jgi:uncharacterized protein with PIN domain
MIALASWLVSADSDRCRECDGPLVEEEGTSSLGYGSWLVCDRCGMMYDFIPKEKTEDEPE